MIGYTLKITLLLKPYSQGAEREQNLHPDLNNSEHISASAFFRWRETWRKWTKKAGTRFIGCDSLVDPAVTRGLTLRGGSEFSPTSAGVIGHFNRSTCEHPFSALYSLQHNITYHMTSISTTGYQSLWSMFETMSWVLSCDIYCNMYLNWSTYCRIEGRDHRGRRSSIFTEEQVRDLINMVLANNVLEKLRQTSWMTTPFLITSIRSL